MNPVLSLIAVLAVVAIATAVGLIWRAGTGRVRTASGEGRLVISASDIGAQLGAHATLLQFSTEYCAPCRATRAMLTPVATERDGVIHIEIDLTARPELARRFNILQTPTVFLLNGAGEVHARIGGAPRRDEFVARLDELLENDNVSA